MPCDPLDACRPFLDALASEAPAPGGGAVAGLCGALAAALGRMVAALTLARKRSAPAHEEMTALRAAFDDARAELLALGKKDAAAYAAFRAAPKDDSAARQAALGECLEVPLSVMARADALQDRLAALCARGTPHAQSDVRIAQLLAHAALVAAGLNVAVNLPLVADAEAAAAYRTRADQLRRASWTRWAALARELEP